MGNTTVDLNVPRVIGFVPTRKAKAAIGNRTRKDALACSGRTIL